MLTRVQGSNILSNLLTHSSIKRVEYLARREPSSEITASLSESNASKLSPFVSKEPPASWASHLRTASPHPDIFFSSLATTRGNAGSLEAQRALEHDANLELARAAKDSGTKVYVLVSSGGANSSSSLPYLKLKGDIEDSIIGLGFEKTVILQPGVLLGQRQERRLGESVLRGFACAMGAVNKPWLRDWWAQDASEVARAAVQGGLNALEGKGPEGEKKVSVLTAKDILRLGRTE